MRKQNLNKPANIFRELSSLWHYDAACERVDVLAAELTSHIAGLTGSVCLGLIKTDATQKFFGLVYLLDSYGLILRQRYREQGDAVFIFLDKKTLPVLSEYEDAVVTERIPENPILTDKEYFDTALALAA